MSEQDSDKKNPSTTGSQGAGGSKSGGSAKGGSTPASAAESGKASPSGGKKTASGGRQAQSRGGRGGRAKKGGDSYQSLPRVPGRDPLEAHGRLPAPDIYQVAPRVWPD